MGSLPLPIWDVHLSDNYGVEDEHLALGDGNLDMRQAFEALSRRNFDGVLNLEICKDAKNRQYSIDSCSTKETDLILRSRNRVLEALS